MAFERVDQKQGVTVDVDIGFDAIVRLGRRRISVDDLGRCGTLGLADHARVLVDLEARVQRQHGRVRVGLRWKSIEVEPVGCLLDAVIQRLELVALERFAVPRVLELDDDAMLLGVRDVKARVGERRDESRAPREVLGLLQEVTPRDTERHMIGFLVTDGKRSAYPSLSSQYQLLSIIIGWLCRTGSLEIGDSVMISIFPCLGAAVLGVIDAGFSAVETGRIAYAPLRDVVVVGFELKVTSQGWDLNP